MASPLPVIRGTQQALYPFTLTLSFDTVVVSAQSGNQQRWGKRPGLVKLALHYGAMTQTQRNTLKTLFTTAKGQFANDLQITIGGVTYSNFALESDEFHSREADSTQYDADLVLTQRLTGGLSPGTKGQDFPLLANGAIAQLPYVQKKRFQTSRAVMAAGPQYGYAWFAGGLSGLPSDGLMAWELEEQNLTDADLSTRLAHFVNNWGRWFTFKFTDEDGTPYSNTHYASDELAVTYNCQNSNALRIALEATN